MRQAALLLLSALLCMQAASAQSGEALRVQLPDETITSTPWRTNPAAVLAKGQTAVAAFASANPLWKFQLDPRTGVPHYAWGNGLPIPGFASVSLMNAEQASRAFIGEHAGVFAIDPGALRLVSAELVGGKVYVRFIQTWHGVDVLNSRLDLRIAPNGRVFMFGADLFPGIDIATEPLVGTSAARAFATAGFDSMPAEADFENVGTFVLPLVHPSHIEYKLVRNVIVRTDALSHWDTYVDAADGSVLWRRNLVTQFSGGGPGSATTSVVNGRVMIRIFHDSWLWGDTLVPMRQGYVTVNSTTTVTDNDGRFSVDIGNNVSATLAARLSGPYARARRADSTGTVKNAYVQTTVVPGQEVNLVWDDKNSAASERNVFYHITAVRNYTRTLDTSSRLVALDKQMDGICNRSDIICNANWDGRKVNFAKAGSQGMSDCGNTGEIPDVIYHEYGHAINTFIYSKSAAKYMRDGALGEATADINANMLRDDPRIGIGFMVGGGGDGTIRNSKNTRKYPQNLVGEIHDDGMILTGAVWEMRDSLGIDIARILTHTALYGTPDGANHGDAFASYFMEILAADDDDGDLSNGTPHSRTIITCFMNHGIPASAMVVTHTPLGDQPAGTTPYPMTGTITFNASFIADLLEVKQIRVRYTTDNWASSDTTTLPWDKASKSFGGGFPVQPAGSIVRYYIEVEDAYGSLTRIPGSSSYLFLVGLESRMLDTGEKDDSWSVTSTAASGAWVRAVPIGTYDKDQGTPPDAPWLQPNEDHTAAADSGKCWVTGNAQASLGMNANDVDNGKTVLTTRAYALSTMNDPVLRYARWFCNYHPLPNSSSRGRWTVSVSSDGGSTWSMLEYTTQQSLKWDIMVFRLRNFIQLTDSMVFSFTASDGVPDATVEAAVDDFEILDTDAPVVSVTDAVMPHSIELAQNYPNPFNPATTISYSVPKRCDVTLEVRNQFGGLVATVFSGSVNAGSHRVVFDASHLPSGVYLYTLNAGGESRTQRMVVLK